VDPALTLPPPAGFCALTRQQPADAAALDTMSGILKGVQTALLGMSADCGQLEAFRSHNRLVADFARYQSPVFNWDSKSSRAEWVKAHCASLRAEAVKSLAGVTAEVNARMAAAKSQARVNEMIPLGVVAEDPDACYTGVLQALTEGGTKRTQVGVSASTVLKGRIVNYILFTDYRDADTLRVALDHHKRNVAALLVANGEQPADEVAWAAVKDTANGEQLRRFIAQFPGSARRGEAEERLKAVGQTGVAEPVQPVPD
ncbi:MAG: hypothetical protein J2P53_17885, partial [Bradyrhizobiaceae bacterium]|nr:hypothetical protein [Bradyrhizobiaceae bacterium]